MFKNCIYVALHIFFVLVFGILYNYIYVALYIFVSAGYFNLSHKFLCNCSILPPSILLSNMTQEEKKNTIKKNVHQSTNPRHTIAQQHTINHIHETVQQHTTDPQQTPHSITSNGINKGVFPDFSEKKKLKMVKKTFVIYKKQKLRNKH